MYSHLVPLTVAQCLGWNHLQTAATPPPALGSTSSHTWRQIKHQHVMTATTYDLEILIQVRLLLCFPPAVSISLGAPVAWPLSASLWISTMAPLFIFFKNHQAVNNLLRFYQHCFSTQSLRANHKSAEQLSERKKENFQVHSSAVQQGEHNKLLRLCLFEVSLRKSMPGHGRVNLPLLEAWGATLGVQWQIQPL